MQLVGLGAGACLSGSLLAKPAKKPARPNIVYIIGDDISMDDWGCYGHPHIRTPHVDALAKQGQRYTNAYLSISSCSPSRCSIITGRWPHNTGACELHTELPKGQVMFPHELKKAGYYTVQAGKWHLGSYARVAFDKVYDRGKDKGPGGEGRWVKCLKERPKDKPFFAWFAAHDAHRSWQPDKAAKPHTRKDVVVPPYMVDDAPTRDDLAKYYDEVQRFDRYIGLVVKELKRQGVYDNTLIFVMADNARPFSRCKTRLLDSGIKTPLVISWPAKLKPSVTNSLVSSIDIAPTALVAAGVKIPKTVQGVSMLPIFADPSATVRDYTFGEHNWHDREDHERMVHWKNFTYIRNRRPNGIMTGPADAQAAQATSYASLLKGYKAGTLTPEQAQIFAKVQPAEQLFDSTSDPHQFKNLAKDPAHAETLAHLRAVLAKWEAETGDSCPKNLTKDTSERFSGKRFPKSRTGKWRGTMPGSDKNAAKINAPGPR